MKKYGLLSLGIDDKECVWNKLIIIPILLSSLIGLTTSVAYAESIIVPFYDRSTGKEPWLTDLTPKGTRLLKDLKVGSASSFGVADTDSNVISSFGYKYFFAAGNLYRSDGTAKRTKVENNIADMSITHLVKHNNTLFFTTSLTPAIYRVFPRGQAVSADSILTYDQSKIYPRRIIDIKAGAYDNKMLLLIENIHSSGKRTYDLRLANGQKGWSKILKYKFDQAGSAPKTLKKIFVTSRVIYFITNNDVWMTKNTAQPPKVALLKKYKIPNGEKLKVQTIIADKNYIYLGTYKGGIYKTDGSQRRADQLSSTVHEGGYARFHAFFKNHLITSVEEINNGQIVNKLIKLDLKTGWWADIATSKRKLGINPPPPVFIRKPVK